MPNKTKKYKPLAAVYSDISMKEKGPSEHLSWKELGCKDGTEYPKEWRESRAVQLAEIFEFLRHEIGDKPIQILSAYRTPTYNMKIGGARNSMHCQGRALDLRAPKGMTVPEFHKFILSWAKFLNIGGVGLYKTFVHIDTRIISSRASIRTWTGNQGRA